MSTGNLVISVYEIELPKEQDVTHEAYIKTIIKNKNEKLKKEKKVASKKEYYKQLKNRDDLPWEDVTVRLFISTSIKKPDWVPFIEPIIKENINDPVNTYQSFVAFISIKERLFAVCGGAGNHVINDYKNDSFGLDVVKRLIKENDRSILSIKDRGFVGNIIGSQRIFRNSINLVSPSNYGKVFKDISLSLTPQQAAKLGYSKAKVCHASSSLKIYESVSFETLIGVLKNLEELLKESPNLEIQGLQIVDEMQNTQLTDKLIKNLFQQIRNNEGLEDYLLCHKNIFEFYTSDKYNVRVSTKGHHEFHKPLNLKNLLDTVNIAKDYLISANDEEHFRKRVEKITIEGERNDQVTTSFKRLDRIISTALEDNGKVYFLEDGNWHYITQKYLEAYIYTGLQKLTNEHFYPKKILSPWEYKENKIQIIDEGDYNISISKNENVLLVDKQYYKTVELCDLLVIENDHLDFVHIKRGFAASSARELSNQVLISALLVQQDLAKDPNEFYRVFYQSIHQKNPSIKNWEHLKELLHNKRINYVYAFIDEAKDERWLHREHTAFDSNVAKITLVDLFETFVSIADDKPLSRLWFYQIEHAKPSP